MPLENLETTAPADPVLQEGWYTGDDQLVIVEIPEGVEEIGPNVFAGVETLTSVKLLSTLKTIGDGAFFGCTRLTVILLPASLTSIGDGAFANCSELKTNAIPDGVTTIPSNAFAACMSLTSVEYPANLQEIGELAFYNNLSLANVNLPEGLTKIGSSAFGLSVEVVENLLKQDYGNVLIGLEKVMIHASVQEIGDGAFAYQCTMTDIGFAEGSRLDRIGGYAFAGCLSQTSLDLMSCMLLREIGEYALAIPYSLKTLKLPASVSVFGDNILHEMENPLAIQTVAGTPAEEWMLRQQKINQNIRSRLSVTANTTAYIPEPLRSDWEVVRTAMNNDPDVLELAGKDFLACRDRFMNINGHCK